MYEQDDTPTLSRLKKTEVYLGAAAAFDSDCSRVHQFSINTELSPVPTVNIPPQIQRLLWRPSSLP
jgi:hypothetical protein